jgi:hypothetical protein
MTLIVPVVNPSLALITPGYPLVVIPKSNPTAGAELAEPPQNPTGVAQSAVKQKAIAQAGHQNDRVI